MLSIKSYLLLIVLIITALFSSCSKKAAAINYNTLGQETAIADNYSTAMYLEIDNQAKNSSNGLYKTDWTTAAASITGACANIQVTGVGYPKTLTVDYGAGCTDSTGITRKGLLTALFSNAYSAPGAIITITTTNYAQSAPNSKSFYQYSGKKVITNNGPNGLGHPVFTIDDDNATITEPNGNIIAWSTSRTNEWIQGYNTPYVISDDVYSITGWAQGSTSDGTYFRMDIAGDKPFIKSLLCPYISSGEVTYTVNGTQLASEDFAQVGNCAGGADTLHYNNTVYVFNVY